MTNLFPRSSLCACTLSVSPQYNYCTFVINFLSIQVPTRALSHTHATHTHTHTDLPIGPRTDVWWKWFSFQGLLLIHVCQVCSIVLIEQPLTVFSIHSTVSNKTTIHSIVSNRTTIHSIVSNRTTIHSIVSNRTTIHSIVSNRTTIHSIVYDFLVSLSVAQRMPTCWCTEE